MSLICLATLVSHGVSKAIPRQKLSLNSHTVSPISPLSRQSGALVSGLMGDTGPGRLVAAAFRSEFVACRLYFSYVGTRSENSWVVLVADSMLNLWESGSCIHPQKVWNSLQLFLCWIKWKGPLYLKDDEKRYSIWDSYAIRSRSPNK